MEDVYNTILTQSKSEVYKVKGSKFYGYAFPVTTKNDVKNSLAILQKLHHTARHFCYAYQIGVINKEYRVNDDGEPNNSAGMQIYGQLQAFDVTNILVVSVRYFGGTKLGVGGLISAYKTSAQLTLENCNIVTKTINTCFKLFFDYDQMNNVQRIIKEHHVSVVSQKLEISCEYTISVRQKEASKIYNLFKALHKITIKKAE
jgi:Uncharacterized conserved protein